MRARVCLILVLVLGLPTAAAMQTPSAADTLRITTFGGLLGYFDGFVEFPSGPWDESQGGGLSRPTPAGGLIGVQEWLAAHRAPGDLVLLTGNNMPGTSLGDGVESDLRVTQATHPFWRRLADLKPAAIGIGVEDVLRGVRAGDLAKQGAGPFAAFARTPGLPFVASNAIIREHKHGLNAIDSDGFSLEVSRDESVELVTKLKITCGGRSCAAVAHNGTTAEIADLGPIVGGEPAAAAAPAAHLDATPDGEDHLTIDLSSWPLSFGRRYAITLTGTSARFTFATVRALTPRDNPAPFAGLPVLLPAAVNGVQPVVLAFTTASVKEALRSEAWSWTAASAPAGAPCNGVDACTLDFLDAVGALKALRPLLARAAPSLFIALPDLEDAELVDLSAAAPEMRVVIHPPESWVLGRAAAASPGDARPRHSGDLGYQAVVNRSFPIAGGAAPTRERPGDATILQLWARPEWVAETAHQIAVHVATDPDRTQTFVTAPETRVEFVRGAALQYEIANPSASEPAISYFVTGVDGTRTDVAGPFRAYAPYADDARFSDGRPLGNLWTNQGDLMAFLLDVAKSGAHTDLAASTGLVVDSDLVDWIDAERAARKAPIPWLSRFFLSRALFRPDRLSRVTIAGKDLAATLTKMIEAAKSDATELYVAGVSGGYPLDKVDEDHFRVNGREVDPAHFYILAVPASLAKAAGLDATLSTRKFDFFGDADRRLPSRPTTIASQGCVSIDVRPGVRTCTDVDALYATAPGGGARAKATGLGERFDHDRADDLRVYLSVQSAVATLSRTRLTHPDSIPFDAVPNEGSKAKNQRLVNGTVNADLGFDRPKVVYHAMFQGEYSEDRTLAEDMKTTTSIKYPNDKYMAGGRFDIKVDKARVHHYYFGAFDESWFRRNHDDDPITPTREISKAEANGVTTKSTEQTAPITPRIDRSHYAYARAGVQFEPIGPKAYAQIAKLAVNVDAGRRSKEIVGATIAGESRSFDDLRLGGAGKLVNDYFQAQRDAFLANPTFKYDVRPVKPVRVVVESTVTVQLPKTRRGGHGAITSDIVLHRYLRKDSLLPLSPVQSLDVKTKLEVPFPGQLKVAPYYNRYTVTAKDAGHFRVTEWGLKIEFPWFAAWGHGRILH